MSDPIDDFVKKHLFQNLPKGVFFVKQIATPFAFEHRTEHGVERSACDRPLGF